MCGRNARKSAEVAETYRQAQCAAGKEPQVVRMREASVGDTLEDASRVCGFEVMDPKRYFWLNGANAFHEFSLVDDFKFESVWEGCIITGSPEACVSGFKR